MEIAWENNTFTWIVLAVGILGSLLVARWVARETAAIGSPWNRLLPALRALCFFLLVLMIAEPTLSYRFTDGELSRVAILVDDSQSMGIRDRQESSPRYDLVWNTLQTDAPGGKKIGLLEKLSSYHHVELYSISGVRIWDSLAPRSRESEFSILREEKANGAKSPLGIALREILRQPDVHWDSVVLFSDGESNEGVSPEDVVASSGETVPIWTVGVGSTDEPPDLAITSVEVSSNVRKEDLLRGVLRIKEWLPGGTPYRVQVSHGGKEIWSKTVASEQRGVYELPFEFPVKELIEELELSATGSAERRSFPIDLTCEVKTAHEEITLSNNRIDTSTWGGLRANRVLMLDPLGGWETRYIRNALDRDPSWEVQGVLGPAAFSQPFFPQRPSDLLTFDLVIASVGAAEYLSEEDARRLHDYVVYGGGGIVWIDSTKVSDTFPTKIANLLPVTSRDSKIDEGEVEALVPESAKRESQLLSSLRLTAIAQRQPAFWFDSDLAINQQVWSRLLPPNTLRHLQLKPGAEVLLEGVGPSNTVYPLFIFQRFGQGRVNYLATDETWRWRYGVADLYHQRFWNQIAEWSMRPPFIVRGEQVAIDAGKRLVNVGDEVLVRAQVLNEEGTPSPLASIPVNIFHDGRLLSTISLASVEKSEGFYEGSFTAGAWNGESNENEEGEYTIQFHPSGLPEEAKYIGTSIWLAGERSREMDALRQDKERLQKLASLSGGEYLVLSDAHQLIKKLEGKVKGKLASISIPLWQSPWWFGLVIALLCVEWWVRKRVGLQ